MLMKKAIRGKRASSAEDIGQLGVIWSRWSNWGREHRRLREIQESSRPCVLIQNDSTCQIISLESPERVVLPAESLDDGGLDLE